MHASETTVVHLCAISRVVDWVCYLWYRLYYNSESSIKRRVEFAFAHIFCFLGLIVLTTSCSIATGLRKGPVHIMPSADDLHIMHSVMSRMHISIHTHLVIDCELILDASKQK